MCSERSGSNLIVQILNAHSTICGPSTKHIISPVARNWYRYGDVQKEHNWQSFLNDICQLINMDFSEWNLQFNPDSLSLDVPDRHHSDVLKTLFRQEARSLGKHILFIKENRLYEYISYLLTYFKQCRFVYLVRDPRDVALSWKKSKNHAGGVVNAARVWQYDQANYLPHYHLLAPQLRAVKISYESLISSPFDTLTTVIQFLGLAMEHGMLTFSDNPLTRKNASKDHTWKNLSKPLLADNANKFKTELSELEICAIEKICQYEMHQLGYELLSTDEQREKLTQATVDSLDKSERAQKEVLPRSSITAHRQYKARFYQR